MLITEQERRRIPLDGEVADGDREWRIRTMVNAELATHPRLHSLGLTDRVIIPDVQEQLHELSHPDVEGGDDVVALILDWAMEIRELGYSWQVSLYAATIFYFG